EAHRRSVCPATVSRPDTIPPPPRRELSRPSGSREKEIGPRLDATSTGPTGLSAAAVPMSGVRLSGGAVAAGQWHTGAAGAPGLAGHQEGDWNWQGISGYSRRHNFITLIQRGGG